MIAIPSKVGGAMVQSLARAKLKNEQILEVYHKASAIISTRKQWPSGHTETLYDGVLRGRKAQIWIKNDGGRLNLYLFREGKNLMGRFYSKPLLIGLFKPDVGWVLCVNEAQYREWHIATRRAMEAKQVQNG